METVEVKISEFYSSGKYFPYMPRVVFEALERAFLNGEQTALVPAGAYNEMMYEYKKNKGGDGR